MEALLIILGDLAALGSIALLFWGMVLCAVVGLGEASRERLAAERLPAVEDRPVHGFSDPLRRYAHVSPEPLAPYADRLDA